MRCAWLIALSLLVLSSCDRAEEAPPPVAPVAGAPPVAEAASIITFTEEELIAILRLSPVPPVPPDPTNQYADDERAATLGHRLFFDARLSANGQVSCATCHDPKRSFSDPKPLAVGIGEGSRHAPALVNPAHQPWFNWDGRADTLWAQAIRPLTTDIEMGATASHIAAVVERDPDLRNQYEALFFTLIRDVPATIHMVNVAKAIAAYERKLVFADAPFDVFVAGLRREPEGDLRAISRDAKLGLKLFIGRANCVACHAGPTFSDGAFHSVRIAPLVGEPKDAGRFAGVELAKADPFNAASTYSDARASPLAQRLEFLIRTSADWGRFKTPTLRNVAITPPYMHQGQKATLRDVLAHYSTFEDAIPPGHDALDGQEMLLRPLALTPDEVDQLLAFLESLTSPPRDAQWIHPPEH